MWVSLSLDAGTPLHEVSKLAGHAASGTTQAVYAHLTKDAGKRAADRLWAALRAEAETPDAGSQGAESGHP